MIDDIDGLRLTRYLAGECSPEEAEQVRRWVAADPARPEAIEEFRRVWEVTGRHPAGWDVDAAWDQFVQARAARQVRPIRTEPSPHAPRRFTLPAASSLGRIAAAVLLLAGGAGVLWRLVLHAPPTATAPTPDRVYATARGERAETHLADGTRVLLGPDSRLEVPADYGATARQVRLTGEAYFEVVHDSTRPFTVRAKNAVALDLGTRFGVRAYAEDPEVQVVVAEGRVALGRSTARDSATVLRPGELGRLDSGGTSLIVRGVDLGRYLGWIDGQLVLRGALLRDAVVEIGRWRDVEVRLASPLLGEKRLDATFTDETAAEALGTLAAALGLRVMQEGNVYTLSPK